MKDVLRVISSDVIEWLKFAEAKNGALFVANLATIMGILQVMSNTKADHPVLIWYVRVAVGLLLVSAVICLTSFAPQLRMPWLAGRGRTDPKDNLLFYGDISKYTPSCYLQKLYAFCGKKQESGVEIERSYAEQIITNSRITLRKYKVFSIAIWLTITGLVTPAVSVILYIIDRYCKEMKPNEK